MDHLLMKQMSYNLVSVKMSNKSLPIQKCFPQGINPHLTRWRGQCLQNKKAGYFANKRIHKLQMRTPH